MGQVLATGRAWFHLESRRFGFRRCSIVMMETTMGRNKFGQFEKGTCGNPRGRPRRMPLRISDEQLRQDFFVAAEALVSIVENGKRKLIPVHIAIQKQLMLKAASGDMRAIVEYNKRRERYCLEHVKLQLSNLEAIANAEDRLRDFPEDVTDEFKHALKLLKADLDPYFRFGLT
jgi:phage-related protein